MPANVPEYFTCTPGQVLNFISTNTSTGYVVLTEMTWWLAPHKFNQLAGPVEAKTNAPWLKKLNANIVRINTLALGARLPTISSVRGYVEAGGLMSYGANTADLFRRAGEIVDKILKGAKPADIPVEQPTGFELVINLTTAQALGLKIPEAFLLRADAVIE
jgi:hypothetical protein